MKMKARLIILEQGNIVVSDEEIKKNNYIEYNKNIYKCSKVIGSEIIVYEKDKYAGSFEKRSCLKIIASDNPEYNIQSIDYNGLEEQFGIVDVERLANLHKVNISAHWSKESFKQGFKKAQELNNKKFSLKDMKRIFSEGMLLPNSKIQDSDNIFNELIKSIQYKVFDVEIETEVSNNSIKIIKIVM